jgi:hypothetical protein
MKDRKKLKGIICATFVTIVSLILCTIQPLYSGDIDNYAMALVANKLFAGPGQDGYIHYLHPILCKIFEVIHWLFPKADSFSLVAEIMLLMGIWWISFYLYITKKSNMELVVAYAVLFSFIAIENLFSDNFTRWAVFLCMVGMVTLLRNGTGEKRYTAIGTFFVMLGVMWRQMVIYLYIPFLVLMLFIELIQKTKEERKNFLIYVLRMAVAPISCILVLAGIWYFVDHSEQYSQAIAYDNARSAVVDYPTKPYAQIADELDGITQNDYNAICNWFLMDTDFIDTSILEKIGAVAFQTEYSMTLHDLKLMMEQVMNRIVGNRHLLYLCVLLGILFLVGFFLMNGYYKVEFILMFWGMDIMLLYLVYAGRAIERAFYPVIYATIVSVTSLLQNKKIKAGKIVYAVLLLIALSGIGYGIMKMSIKTNQSVWMAADGNIELESLEQDNIYVWSCSSWTNTLVRKVYMEEGKLISESVMQRNLQEGNWFYGQVFFRQYMDMVGIDNPINVILQDNAYYVGDNCLFLLYYLQEHVDSNIQALQVDEILGTPVWQFCVLEE